MSQLPWGDVRNAMKGDDGKTRVPDGVYDCKIASTKAGATNSGYEKVNSRFVVLSGPYEGGSIFMDFIFTADKPGGLSLLGDRLRALGISDDMLTDDLSMEGLAKLMIGRTAQLQLATRTFNGKEYDDVKYMKPLPNPGGGFSFGGDTILPSGSVIPAAVPAVPGVPPVPMPVASAPVPVPVSPADGENGLPPEPPF